MRWRATVAAGLCGMGLMTGVGLSPAAAGAEPDQAWLQQTLTACAACHGKQGQAPVSPVFPTIGGQYDSYLLHALKAYRDGERQNVVMRSLVKGMSDAQLAALADYFSRQSSGLRTLSHR